MKRIMKPMLLTMCLIASLSSTGVASASSSQIFIDSKPVVCSVQPKVIKGYTMIQLRTIGDELGCDVEYSAPTKKITLSKSKTKLELWIGQTDAKVNGANVFLESAPVIVEGYTMVPLRAIATVFSCDVDYNESTKDIHITTKLPDDGVNNLPGTETKEENEQVMKDHWGNKIRTTNLPKNADMYPYIREDIPNWAYEKAALAWNNNMWDVSNNPDRPTARKMKDTPAELWSTPGFGEELWDKPHTTAVNGTVVSTKTVIESFLKEQLNTDYRNIKSDYTGRLLNVSGVAVSNYSVNDYSKQTIVNLAGDFNKYALENELVMKSDFKVMYEGMWNDCVASQVLVRVPVLVTTTCESRKGNEAFGFFGGAGVNYSKTAGVKELEQGKTYTAVMTYTMFKNPKDGRWQLWYGNMDPSRTLNPTFNMMESISPEIEVTNTVKEFRYTWMKKDVPCITKYQDYEASKIMRQD